MNIGHDSKSICCICRKPFLEFGHNAEPVAKGRCCNLCNDVIVIPARIQQLRLAGADMKGPPNDGATE